MPTFVNIAHAHSYVPLTMFTINAQCLSNKFTQLSDFFAQHDPDIICITETWFNSQIQDNEFTPDGYSCFRKDRKLSFYTEGTYQQEARGGVCTIIKNSLKPILFSTGEADAEILWVKIQTGHNGTATIGNCYRPETDEINILSKIAKSTTDVIQHQDSGSCILTGDFNFRSINWQLNLGSSDKELMFLEIVNNNSLQQLVDSPTRGDNILDLVLTNNIDMVDKITIEEPFSTSDHNCVKTLFNLPSSRTNEQHRKVYLYSEGDYPSLNEDIRDMNWAELLSSESIEENWTTFKSIYSDLVEKHIPSKTVKPGQRLKPPWTRYKSVKKAKRKRRDLWIQYKISNLEADRLLYQEQVAQTELTIRRAKMSYEDKLVEGIKTEPKRFWNYSRHFTRSSQTIEVLEDNDIKITDDREKAEILNNFFISVLVDEPELSSTSDDPPEVASTLHTIQLTPEDIRKKLTKLKPNKASGPDGVNINVLRNSPDFDRPLAMLFQQSLDTGSIPQDWKDANVTPLFKKGSRTSCNNYRPVFLTSEIVNASLRRSPPH